MRYGNLKCVMEVQTNGAILQRLIQNRVLNPHSAAALRVALDGWHDTTIHDFVGLPDKHVGKLFTFDDVAEITITKNSSPIPLDPGPWDVRIAVYPFGQTVSVKPGTCVGSSVVVNDSSSIQKVSNVTVSYAKSGTTFPDMGVGGVAENTQFMTMSNDFLTVGLKGINTAVEVVNQTNPLHAGGLVTACNVPQPSVDTNWNSGFCYQSNGFYYTAPVRMVATPPKDLTEMVKYSPFQGDAKKGIYINTRMQYRSETVQAMPVAPLIFTDDFRTGVSPNIPVYAPLIGTQTVGGTTFGKFEQGINWFDQDMPVIMFTGLPEETTLTIRVRWFGQIIPDEDNNIFLRAAKPAPIYDPNFFEIYSRVQGLIPQACYFTDNPSGEWWKTMLGGIAKAAAPLLMMIPHPLAKAAGVAAGGMGAALESAADDSRAKRRKKNASGAYDKRGIQVRKDAYGNKINIQTGKNIKKKKKNKSGIIPNAPPK